MDWDCASKIAVIIGNASILAGFIVALRQFYLMRKRKQQSTVEFYHTVRKDFIKALRRIEKKFGDDKSITENKVKKSKRLLDDIKEYLSHMERFAVGVNDKIYDIKTFRRTVGANYTIRWYYRLQDAITYIRKDFDNDSLYNDLKELVLKLEEDKSLKQVSSFVKIKQIVSNILRNRKDATIERISVTIRGKK